LFPAALVFKPDTQKKSAAVAICHANGSYLSANQILSTIHNAYSLPKIAIIFFISKMPAKKETRRSQTVSAMLRNTFKELLLSGEV